MGSVLENTSEVRANIKDLMAKYINLPGGLSRINAS